MQRLKSLYVAVILLYCCRLSFACSPQLPDEGTIPGVGIFAPEGLPSEAELPGRPRVANRVLPPESSLPPNSVHQETDPAGNNEPRREPVVAQDTEGIKEFSQRPLLRLLGGGPIAPIQSVCFSADSKRILAGGQDKALHAWRLIERPGGEERWFYEKPVYWQIYRAARGQIFSVTAGKKLIAFAGTGASASNGEIALVDPDRLEFSRALVDLEKGHLSPIHTVATNRDSDTIASIDFDGRTLLWRRDSTTGQWGASVLSRGDNQDYDKPTRDELAGWRARGGGLALSDSSTIVFPQLAQPFQLGLVPSWQLVRRQPNGVQAELQAPEFHRGMVAAIAISADGNRIVSADIRGFGRLFYWDLTRSKIASVIKTEFPIRCLGLSRDGRRIAIGTARNDKRVSQVQVSGWSNENRIREIATWNEKLDVESCAFDGTGNKLVYTQSDSLIVRSIQSQDHVRLTSKIMQPFRVAFPDRLGDYRIAIHSQTNAELETVFDPGKLTLVRNAEDDRQAWMPANPQPGKWTISVTSLENGLDSYAVVIDGKQLCRVPIDTARFGSITHFTFVPDRETPARPLGLIIGTTMKNHVFVFRIDNDRCDLVREYRGHTAAISCTGISADHKYLVSSSQDGTVKIWKLDGALEKRVAERDTNDLWGAEFEVHDDALVVTHLVKDGPVYFRGIRKGDVVDRISWSEDDNNQQAVHDPLKMLAQLKTAPSETMIRFEYHRGAAKKPPFYLYPAWQPLASLVVNRDREWAFWTPYGYYDASFNGHKIFGWQINRGVNRVVEFFRAAELKEDFEKPKMMQNLLTAGSVEDAFAVKKMKLPNNLSNRLGATGRLKPTVEIISVEKDPHSNAAMLLARVETPHGVEIARVKAFANGIPATDANLVKKYEKDGNQVSDYRFRFSLPSDKQIKLQVLASSNLGHGAIAEKIIAGSPMRSQPTPRVFLMALGVSEYQDSQIPRLDFAHLNARAVLDSLSQSELSRERSVLLTGSEASKSMWMITTKTMAEDLKAIATPDDLLVIFLSGHGFRDATSGDYFYLTANSSYGDILSRRYADCVSLDDLHAFGEIACRKLVILDTCHSGALQGLRQQNLKSVVRTLENDLFYTLTASEGSQEAFELKERGLGLFTSRLIDALRGDADLPNFGGNDDGQVTLQEVINFLQSTVPIDAARLGASQFPTASPADLLELAEIRLTKSSESKSKPVNN